MDLDTELNQIIEKLKNRIPLPPLVPELIWDKDLSKQIGELKIRPISKAALYLWNDDLNQAHLLAQEIESATGSLIHAIMHRRQADFSNSKYWFRQVGAHPVFINLVHEFSGWDPVSFVDRCQQVAADLTSPLKKDLETFQQREMELIAHYCLEME